MKRLPRPLVLVALVAVGTASCFDDLRLLEVDAAAEGADAGSSGDGPVSALDGPSLDAPATVPDGPVSADLAVGDTVSPVDVAVQTSDGSTCAANRPCKPANPCHAGSMSCAGGLESCIDTGASLTDGAECGDNAVCKGGACQPCASNASCPVPGKPCRVGAISCTTGSPVCREVGDARNGMDCGAAGSDLVCRDGVCAACVSGVPCDPPGNPCNVGAQECTTGAPRCRDTGNAKPPGSSCGDGRVCGARGCVACVQNAVCDPMKACRTGVLACGSGVPVCVETVVMNGMSCGPGLVCNGGQCASCPDGAGCTVPTLCHVGKYSCATGTAVCMDVGKATDDTFCGPGMACKGGSCVSSCTSDMCGSTCTDLKTDVANCGACGHDCRSLAHVAPGGAASCSGGHCVIPASACAAGFGHCGGGPPDSGCETDISAKATCGCGSCTAGQVCNPSGVTYQCACAAATPNACPGKCVDLQNDGMNCGSCGHSCLGGTCSAGSCQPVQIYGAGSAYALVVDGQFVYFTRDESIGIMALARVGKDGSDPHAITSVNIGSFPKVVVANGVAYWADQQLRACALPNCSGYGNPAPSQMQVGRAVSNNSRTVLFWDNVNDMGVSQVMTNLASPKVVTDGAATVAAADDQFFYYVDNKSLDDMAYRVPVAGGPPSPIGPGVQTPDIAVTSKDLFFSGGDASGELRFVVYRLALAQASATQPRQLVGFLSGLEYSLYGGLVADESYVYWFYGSGDADSAVLRCPTSGCGSNPTVMMRSDLLGHSPNSLTMDATAVYFATDKGIFKIAKP